MPGFGDLVQKAFYLGVGLASYAGEKAGGKISELRSQVQKLADEMVARGEMNTEEARRFVEDMMNQAQQPQPPEAVAEKTTSSEPRRIEILEDDEQVNAKETPTSKSSVGDKPTEEVDKLRDQVKQMQDELRRLQRE
jgi:polyhydroxyalkanoate synthesis regulator phasin